MPPWDISSRVYIRVVQTNDSIIAGENQCARHQTDIVNRTVIETCKLLLSRFQLVIFQFIVKRLSRDSQATCCFGFISTTGFQRLQNCIFFNLLQ